MRDDILNFITANMVAGFNVTSELPWGGPALPLYMKNYKYVYVDLPQTIQETGDETLDGNGTVEQFQTIDVYVVCDAKTLPTNYEALVAMIISSRLALSGVTERLCQVETSYQDDAVVTIFAISSKQLISNCV